MDDCRLISNFSTNYLALSTQALGALEQIMSFTQLRFLCHKTVPGRTFLVATNTTLSGEHVLNYFTAKTYVLPDSCGSFYVLSKDNWIMANNCRDWGYENQQYKIRKWHHSGRNVQKRLLDHTAFIHAQTHWVVFQNRWECDDDHQDQGFAIYKIFVL